VRGNRSLSAPVEPGAITPPRAVLRRNSSRAAAICSGFRAGVFDLPYPGRAVSRDMDDQILAGSFAADSPRPLKSASMISVAAMSDRSARAIATSK